MPCVGFRCPPKGKSYTPPYAPGSEHTFEHCLEACPRPCQPIPVLAALRKQVEDDAQHPRWGISASSLTGCRAEWYLKNHEAWTWPASKVLQAFQGTATHMAIADALMGLEGENGWIVERHLSYEIETAYGPFTAQGTADAIDVRRRHLWDWKTTGFLRYAPHPEHGVQLNVYAWLARMNGIEVDRASLWYVSGRNTLVAKVPLLPDEEVEAAVRAGVEARLALHMGTAQVDDDMPEGVGMWDGRKCRDWCAVSESCSWSKRLIATT